MLRKNAYYDSFIDQAAFLPYQQLGLEALFSTSDIVSVHLPVTADTKGMIDRRLFSLMQPHALFVNTAKAVVVNINDLYQLLLQQKIRGAILDVFDNEPPDELDYKIIDLQNVLATPHIAGATHEVEDHHVRILNSMLTEWFIKGHHRAERLANRDILTTYILLLFPVCINSCMQWILSPAGFVANTLPPIIPMHRNPDTTFIHTNGLLIPPPPSALQW